MAQNKELNFQNFHHLYRKGTFRKKENYATHEMKFQLGEALKDRVILEKNNK